VSVHSGGTRGASRSSGPPSSVNSLNTYVTINIYSIRNINFIYFFKYDDFGKK